MLRVLDEEFGSRMNTLFLDDLRHAEELTLGRARQRHWRERVAEKAAHLATRLLQAVGGGGEGSPTARRVRGTAVRVTATRQTSGPFSRYSNANASPPRVASSV